MNILTPKQAHDIIANGGHYELGVRGAEKVGFREFVSYVELAAIKGAGDDNWVWVVRDEAADNVDFVTAAEADHVAAEGYIND